MARKKMQTKTEMKTAEVKETEVKAADNTAAAVKEAEEAPAEEAEAKAEEAPAVKKTVRTRKTAAAEKKPAVKKPAKKAEMKTTVSVQYMGKDIADKDMVALVKKDWTASKHKISEIETMDLYVKVEENTVYYVINGEITGSVGI